MAKNRDHVLVAYFAAEADAESAKQELEKIGISDVHIKQNCSFELPKNVIESNGNMFPELMLGSSTHAGDYPAFQDLDLLGASVANDNPDTSIRDLVCDHAFTLVGFTDWEKREDAVALIRENKGRI